jgi:hypothetical protein
MPLCAGLPVWPSGKANSQEIDPSPGGLWLPNKRLKREEMTCVAKFMRHEVDALKTGFV